MFSEKGCNQHDPMKSWNSESAFGSPIKNAILVPPSKWLPKSIRWSENTRNVHLNARTQHFSDYLLGFGGSFLRGTTWHFSDFEMYF